MPKVNLVPRVIVKMFALNNLPKNILVFLLTKCVPPLTVEIITVKVTVKLLVLVLLSLNIFANLQLVYVVNLTMVLITVNLIVRAHVLLLQSTHMVHNVVLLAMDNVVIAVYLLIVFGLGQQMILKECILTMLTVDVNQV